MGIEARRAIDRLRLERVLDDEGAADAHQALAVAERAIGAIRLTGAVLRIAGQPILVRPRRVIGPSHTRIASPTAAEKQSFYP